MGGRGGGGDGGGGGGGDGGGEATAGGGSIGDGGVGGVFEHVMTGPAPQRPLLRTTQSRLPPRTLVDDT